MNGAQGGSLQNVLSISTAANNRYLLHFNSLNSLTQWTAGIRLAMFEQATLQEAYTGSLIAGKGRYLNNIKQIMERSKFVHDDWARVRFGAGTVWKRCWCVITPPDEKEFAKAQKMAKKESAYGRAVFPKGDIKFYDTRKVTKKTRPIATIKDAYAAYAIYPQSKPLIDQSTLVKLEGLVTIHTGQQTTTEGFIFVMPEAHAAVSGFEMMLRWLFPVYDTFGLYGRPTRLIADTLDQRGLMFAMPKDRRYGYLDTLDVSGLIHTEGSQNWSERQWRKEMKKLTSTRMTAYLEGSPRRSRQIGSRRTSRNSLPPVRGGVHFQARELPIHSTPGSRSGSPGPGPIAFGPPRRTDSAPPSALPSASHKRAVSDVHGSRKHVAEVTSSRLSVESSNRNDEHPSPPLHDSGFAAGMSRAPAFGRAISNERNGTASPYDLVAANDVAPPEFPPPAPVLSPPAFTHSPGSRPPTQPFQAPELRRAHSNVDAETLHQMHEAVRPAEDGYNPDQPPPDRPTYHQQMLEAAMSRGVVHYSAENGQHDSRQRLSTIPGSPEAVSREAYFHAGSMDGVVDNGIDPHAGERPDLVPVQSSPSINRKPLPRQAPQGADEAAPKLSQVRELEPVTSSPPSSDAGFPFDGVIDDEALARILEDNSRASTFASSATPDYASTASTSDRDTKKQIVSEKPRAGRLKTVGDPEMAAIDSRSGGAGKFDTYHKELEAQRADIPTVDFGPTYAYKPTSRPNTSGTLTPGHMDKRRSRRQSSGDRLRASSKDRLSGYFGVSATSPEEENRQSYFGGRTTPNGIDADASGSRNSVAWTPSAGMPGAIQQGRQSLSPEQWVAWRASLASQPQQAPMRRSATPTFSHQRQNSSPILSKSRQSMNKTPPPFARSPSGDWTGQQRTPPPFARSPSGDWTGQQRTPPSRPNSRGAGVYLAQGNSRSTANLTSTSLTAKEQMHVARSTGTPLINMASSAKVQPEQESGLIGALANREREKAAITQGLRGGAVQQAIYSRQQQAQMEAQSQAQAEYEMQQRYQQRLQAGQFEQMAYQQSLLMQQQNAQMQYQQQLQNRATWYGNQQGQQGYNLPFSQSSQFGPPASVYGGQSFQQQEQARNSTSYVSRPGGQPRR